MIISIEEFNANFNNLTVKEGIKCLGLDTAFKKTGWCKIETTKHDLKIEYGYFHVTSENKYIAYDKIIDFFANIIEPLSVVVIEDTFFSFNPAMFRVISRIGAMAYTIASLKKCEPSYMLATSARKNLGLPAIKKKKEVHKAFIEKIGISFDDEDIIDAMILALNGVTTKLSII